MPSIDDETHCGLSRQDLVTSILPPVLIIELLLGVPGNMIALWVFCRHLHSWKPNVVFLFNLALADFLLLVSLPFRIDTLLRGENWVFGKTWCGINLFMLAANRSASIAFITTVAVNRYFKLIHPHHEVNFISSWKAAGIACFIWTVVISLRLPLLTTDLLPLQKDGENISLCRSFNPYKKPPVEIKLHYIVYLSEFFLSLMILLFCSLRICCLLCRHEMGTKPAIRKAIKVVLIIIVIFIVCFFPGVAAGLVALYLKTLGDTYCEAFRMNGQLFILALGFTYLHSVLDPVIYGLCSSMFRDALKRSTDRRRVLRLTPLHSPTTTSESESYPS